ncbi:hypothetical protein [Aidingimonas halophila]|uniref:Uncharacterized protein n=1 Tax=Aidingimonas halophila TaxID=574349 RepID=A0A1H3EQC6_9GAMM|nr:hypothetical protein [Aidingimonas halophila]GHC31523.1 hypothetical protein GCM10008094_25060 [Aidingimonas halophila]SDX80840.1 hypothetical protein SAMN05443545_107211 [Aidingimonas halophila]
MTGKRIGPIVVVIGLVMVVLGLMAARLFLFVGVAATGLGTVLWLTRPREARERR